MEKWMGLEAAIQHVMKVTGKTRRQALAALMQKVKSGEIRAQGVPKGESEYVDIPPERIPDFPTEH